MMKEFYQVQSEYNGLVAKKYRLQSKSKRQAQQIADFERGNDANVVEDLKQQLIKLTQTKTQYEATLE